MGRPYPNVLTAKPPLSLTAKLPAPIALAASLCCSTLAGAQIVTPTLKVTPLLSESLSQEAAKLAPTFLFADSIRGRTDLETVLDGRAVLRKHSVVVRADRIEYYQPDDRAKASGNVRINRNGNVFSGPLLDLRIDAFEGFLATPRFEFLRNETHGEAERIDFLDTSRSVVKNAWLTSCRRDAASDAARGLAKAWTPDWLLQAASIKLDTEIDEGTARNAVVRFKNVPILVAPSLSFPLSNARRSGFLPPSFNIDNISGLELTQPYYLNIAPNRDATLEPTLRTRRGIDLGGEFRYLDTAFNGKLRGSWMPHDRLRGTHRWSVSSQQDNTLKLPAFSAASSPSTWTLGWSVDRVSDDNFWRDFPRGSSSLTQRLLPADFVARHSAQLGGMPVSAMIRTLSWQTLQDSTAPITPPYDRLPQITLNVPTQRMQSFDWEASADFTRFESDRVLTAQPNAMRAVVAAEISRTWGSAAYQVTPKLKVHGSSYQFDAPASDGRRSAARAVPTLSLDASMAFERDAAFGGEAYVQTLEPRAFYVRTPYTDQSGLPNYDSGPNDFNFATIYNENAFGGNDRIADAHTLTLGATSRWLNGQTGAEVARFALAQRFRFEPQRVALPGGSSLNERVSDLLLGAGLRGKTSSFDATVQYSQQLRQSVRGVIGARYAPAAYQTLNVAYRLQRGQSEQVDVSWQWPLAAVSVPGVDWLLGPRSSAAESTPGRWYSVGRLNYSVPDRRLVDAVLGLEYDADCWLARIVGERLQRGTSNSVGGPESSKRILFQLEFVGFSRIGNNPLSALQRNIPRYQVLREKLVSPSRFTNYE